VARNTARGRKRRKAGSGGSRLSGDAQIKVALAGFVGFALLLLAGYAIFSSTEGTTQDADSFTPNDDGLVSVGSQAPGFTTETIDGESVSLGDDQGAEATMLVFFATWCPQCQNEAPMISNLEDQYGGDLRVIMVSIAGENAPEEDTPEAVRRFVDEYGIEGPAAFDPSLEEPYNVTGTPTNYILDADNEVVAAHAGEAPTEVYEGWIGEALEA
jgi:thiol-disulfide isomerase/thioredoxin